MATQPYSFESLILDQRRTSHLLDAAIQDGYIDEETPLDNTLEMASDIANHRRPHQYLFRATPEERMATLLLISVFGNFDMYTNAGQLSAIDYSPLQTVGLRNILTPHETELEKLIQRRREAPVWAKAELLAQSIRISDTGKCDSNLIKERLSHLFVHEDFVFARGYLRLLKDYLSGNSNHDFLYAQLGEDLPFIFYELMRNPDAPHSFWPSSGVEHAPVVLQAFIDYAVDLKDLITDLRSISRYSSDRAKPASWNASRALSFEEWRRTPTTVNSEAASVVLGSFLELATPLPAPLNLKQALVLREAKGMEKFRAKVGAWVQALHKGEAQLLREITADLTSVRIQVKNRETYGRVSSLTTFAGVPLGVAEMIFALPPIASLSVGSLGAATQARATLLEWKNAWFLWGT